MTVQVIYDAKVQRIIFDSANKNIQNAIRVDIMEVHDWPQGGKPAWQIELVDGALIHIRDRNGKVSGSIIVYRKYLAVAVSVQIKVISVTFRGNHLRIKYLQDILCCENGNKPDQHQADHQRKGSRNNIFIAAFSHCNNAHQAPESAASQVSAISCAPAMDGCTPSKVQ